jgi:hypothetical protein
VGFEKSTEELDPFAATCRDETVNKLALALPDALGLTAVMFQRTS